MAHYRGMKAFITAWTPLGLLLAVGCGQRPAAAPLNRVWPDAPARPRIKLVQIVRDASVFGRPSVLDVFRDLAAGPKKHAILRPQSVAVDGDKYLYVADTELRGVHVFSFGSSRSSFIDRAGKEPLVSPVGVAVCDGNVAVSDSARNQVFLFTPAGRLQKVIDTPDGFGRPTGLAFSAKDKLLYVVDTLASEVCVFDLSGKLVRRFGSRGQANGQFNYPTYVFVDANGKAYVTDSLNFRVQVFDARGRFLFKIGRHGDASGHLGMPKGVAVDRFGHIYVADSYFARIQVFDDRGRFLLAFGEPGEGPGSFQLPCGLTVGTEDRIFVCDSHNQRLQVFQYVGANDAKPSSGR